MTVVSAPEAVASVARPAEKSACFLIVDDDEIDVRTLRRAFSQVQIGNPILVANDGEEALEILRGKAGGPGLSDRTIVILDLNMPRMDGIEFLSEVRRDPDLRRLLVFVLTTSNADEDRLKAYDHLISGYLVKPRSAQGLRDIACLMRRYVGTVELPG